MRKDKYQEHEKRLCALQENMIMKHKDSCSICKVSFDEYKKYGISNTPPCKEFLEELQTHINTCPSCQDANKKWNEDAIKITPEMRTLVGNLKQGKLPDFNILKKVSLHLFNELKMDSKDIRKANEQAEKIVKDSLEDQ